MREGGKTVELISQESGPAVLISQNRLDFATNFSSRFQTISTV